jgi:hypothetical protein
MLDRRRPLAGWLSIPRQCLGLEISIMHSHSEPSGTVCTHFFSLLQVTYCKFQGQFCLNMIGDKNRTRSMGLDCACCSTQNVLSNYVIERQKPYSGLTGKVDAHHASFSCSSFSAS